MFSTSPLPTKAKVRRHSAARIFVLAMLATATLVLQGCSGTSNPAYSGGTTNTPTSGVSLVSIKITPTSGLIGLGENRQLIATGTYNDGSAADLTSSVKWSVSSTSNGSASATNFVAVSASGIVTGQAIGGLTNVSATSGSVTGILQLTPDATNYASSSTAVLTVPLKAGFIDAAYLPQSQSKIQGAYAVQEVNLDADQSASVLPVQAAVLATIAMPSGFIPSATVANQSSSLVAVISYTSPNVQIIDASNLSSDGTNNSIIATFTAPVTQTVTINGIQCMICAGVYDPVTGKLILSTAQGFYTLDMVAGTFTPLVFTPSPAPSASFTLNPIAASPYILSPVSGGSEVQVLDLTNNTTSTFSSGIGSNSEVSLDVVTDYAAVVDGATNSESVTDLTNLQSPVVTPVTGIGDCPGEPPYMNMAAFGVTVNASSFNAMHNLFTSQTSGNCIGVQSWPAIPPLQYVLINYFYGPMPATPDGNAFVNGGDPNAITVFNDVANGGSTQNGLLVDANQQWAAKINLGFISNGISPEPLPLGVSLAGDNVLCSEIVGGCSAVYIYYLPTPATLATLSETNINFGSLATGTLSAQNIVTLTNTSSNITGTANLLSISSVAITGANASDFSESDSCTSTLLAGQSKCTITISFTPGATGARSAVLNVTDDGGASPQTIQLSGTGT